MDREELERDTKTVFDEIHRAQGEDPSIWKRLNSLLTTDYLKVPGDWFVDKICLDAGCGANGNATYSMLRMGAKKVHAFDLNEGIVYSVPRYLEGFEGRYELRVGNVLDIEHADNFFDFTHCSGVLHHADDVYRGLQELARVTKAGGMLYVLLYGQGGLIREFVSFLREKYKCDQEFKFIVDNLEARHFADLFQWISSEMYSHGDDAGQKISLSTVKDLFDRDLVLTIRDRVAAPVYHENSEEDIVHWLKTNGFTSVERLTRYPSYRNVRRFLAPFYYRYDHKLSRLLYGSGAVQLKALKSSS